MIDTIFFLLVFFMVTWVSLVKISGTGLSCSLRQNTRLPSRHEGTPTLTLSPDGKYYLNCGNLAKRRLRFGRSSYAAPIRGTAAETVVILCNVAPNQRTQTLITMLDELQS